jgi:hypothetical protein
MEHQAFRYNFTISEFIYLLFKKKRCPKCGAIMEKKREYRSVEGRKINSKADPFFVSNAKVKDYYYSFYCQQCGSCYTIKELAKKG